MPTGLIVMQWDERTGVEVLAKYPEEIEIQEKTLMQLYSQHEFSGEAGLVTLMVGALNIASYYTGPEIGVYTILLLTTEEDGDAYEDGLSDISQTIVANLSSGALQELLPSLFQRLSVYPTLTEEQQLAMFYANDVKRLILKRLREEAVVSKSEIAIWLKDTYREGFVDIENIISSIIKKGIATLSSVQGYSSDLLFLALDLMILRVPPIQLLQNPVDRHLPESLVDAYKAEVLNFFKSYIPTEEDNLELINTIILNPANYEVLKLMREAIVTRNDLEKLRKKGVDDVDAALKDFWKCKMITVLQDDKNIEYYCLTTDFFVKKYFPRYNLDTIRVQYNTKAQNPNVLVKALDLMAETYYKFKEQQKSSVVEEATKAEA